jgi:hypothetical protein
MHSQYYITCTFLFLVSFTSFAQGLISSPYSFYGIGDISQKGSGYNWSLAGTGIAVRDDLSLNYLNPASYTAIKEPFNQLADFSFNVSITQQTEANSKSTNVDGSLTGVGFWFRLNKNIGVVLGLSPYSNINYNIEEYRQFSGIEGNYTSRYSGEGGLRQVFVGASYEIFDRLSLGIHASYIFGTLARNQYAESDDLEYDLTIEKDLNLNTFHLDYGLQYWFKLNEEKFVLGATFSNENLFRSTYNLNVYQNLDTLREATTSSDEYIIPTTIGGGFSWTHNNKWMFATDYIYQQWSSATFDEGFKARDTHRFSAGISFLPNLNSMKYVNRMGLNIGGYYKNTYLEIDGQGINQYGGTIGLTIPTSGTAIVNFIYERSFRKPEASGLINENFHNITFNVSFFNIWFNRRKFQ